MKIARRTLLKATAATATMMFAPSIVRGQSQSVIKFIPQADLSGIDPVQTNSLVSRHHGMMVFDTLYGLDANFNLQPQMAAGHTSSEDGLTWTITLRDGLRFHDNEPVLARDIIASMRRWGSKDPLGKNLLANTDEVSAKSDKVIEFRLKTPFPQLPFVFGKGSSVCFMMPERLAKTDVSTPISEIIGSGPFRFLASERMAGQLNAYEKFKEYVPRDEPPSFMCGGKVVKVDRVEWHTIPDASTAAASLQSGEMDWWEQPTPDLLPLLQQIPDIAVEVKDKSGLMGHIRLNHLQPPFNNPAIRRALLAGINQADYMTAVMGNDRSLWQDNVGFFTPGSPFVNEAGMQALTAPRDLEKVKADLKAAGYNGEKVVLLVPTDLPALNAMSEVAADVFRRVGINLDYQAQDWGTVYPRLNSMEPVEKGGWNAWCNYLAGVVCINPIGNSYLRGIGKEGAVGWPASERIETLRKEFMATDDAAEQMRVAKELQTQYFEDLPYIPTGFYKQPTAYLKTLSNIVEGFPLFYGVEKSA